MKLKTLILISALGLLQFLIIQVACAAPLIQSTDDQTFGQNDASTQLFNIKVTEDSVTPVIKTGAIKITIPDSLAMIFDDERTEDEILIYGTAADSGKIEETPQITFEDGDKTLVIPVDQDFAKGEYAIITKTYVEGFHSQPAGSDELILTIESGEQYLDSKSKYITTSSTEDNHAPEMPTNLAVTDHENGVIITWTDPTDLDVTFIQILRGKNGIPISGTPYKEIIKGTQQYIDTDVTDGDTVKYIIRATDGKNTSANSEEVSFVAGTATEEPATEEPIAEEPVVEPEAPEEITTEDATCSGFSDILLTDDLCPAVQNLKDKNAIEGYSNGEFAKDGEINRAEFLKIILIYFEKDTSLYENTILNFTDIETDAWYMPFIKTAKELGIVAGYIDGTFKPEQQVTKAEAIKILFETVGAEIDQNVEVAPFKDTPIDAQNAWYLPYAKNMIITGLDEGDANGNFDPFHEMTRGEIADLIYRFSQLK